MLIISELPVFFVLAPATYFGILITLFFIVAGCLLAQKLNLYKRKPQERKDILLAAPIAILLGISFINRWMPSSKVAAIAGIIHLSSKTFLMIAGGLLAIASVWGIVNIITILEEIPWSKSLDHNSRIAKAYSTFSICAVMILAVFWCMQKNGMFLDEIYSYGLSNGYYEPFLKEAKQGNIIDTTFSREEFIDYLTVSEEDAFSYDSVFYNQEKDVHPPLFYVLLHTVSSIFPNTFSKWMGLGLNLLYFFVTLLFIYGISKRLFHNRFISGGMVILYGCTSYALSNVVFIRMYMLSTMLTVALAFFVLKVLNNDQWVYYVLMCIVVCAGLLTHYFFVFYAFFISAFLIIYLLFNKNYTKAVKSSVFLISGVIAFVAIFPTCLHHITAKTGAGTTTVEYISSFSLRRIFTVAHGLAAGYKFPIIVGILLLLFLLINHKKSVSVVLANRSYLSAFIILVCPAILSFLAITLVSSSSRYVANISPFFVFIVGYLIDISIAIVEKSSYGNCNSKLQ